MISAPSVSRRALAVFWKEYDRWDVKSFTTRVRSKYPIVKLGSYISQHSERVKPFEHPDATFRILGVTNTGGIFHAYDCLGKEIKQPYQRVDAGDFAYNPYRVNVGSIGIVPPELGNNYISPAYVIFSVNVDKILAEYLFLILKSDWFNPTLRAATAGSVRQNLTYDLLSSLEIPLPTIAEQKIIISKWKKAQEEVFSAKERVIKRISSIDAHFFSDLGLKSPDEIIIPKIFAISWKDFLRWGVRFNQLNQAGADIAQGKYPICELHSILELIQYGTSEKANNLGKGIAVLRIGNIKERSLDLSDIKHIQLPQKTIDSLLLKDGDVLIIRTSGSRDLVGTCAVFRGTHDCVFASYLIRMRFNTSKVYPEFVSWFLNSSLGRQQVDAVSRQIMQNNINSDELRKLQIPLPPIETQRKIMDRVTAGRDEIDRERSAIKILSETIDAEVEALIIGSKALGDI